MEKSEDSNQNVKKAMLMTKLDNTLLFSCSSISLAFAVGNSLLGLDWTRYFIPIFFLCWGMPIYVGYVRGSLLENSIHERIRGWVYFFYGSTGYISYILSWKLISSIGYSNWQTPMDMPYSLLIMLLPVTIFIMLFGFFIVPNLVVLWFLATEGKGRKAKYNLYLRLMRANQSLRDTQNAAISFAYAFFMLMWTLDQLPLIIRFTSQIGLDLYLLGTHIEGWMVFSAVLISVLFFYGLVFELSARRMREVWKCKEAYYKVKETDFVELNREIFE